MAIILYQIICVCTNYLYIICFSGRGERYHNIPGNIAEHATYVTDADTNLLYPVDSDTKLYFEDSMQHDAGSPFKVPTYLLLRFNINAIMYCYIVCNNIFCCDYRVVLGK